MQTDKPLQPDTAIGSWRQWRGKLSTRPVTLGPLSGGRSNRSFLLESGDLRMVLRLNGTASVLPGANRNNETAIWKAASDQGIAPPLLHVDEQSRYLVSAYIENSLPPKPPLDNKYVNHAFGLLEKCHQLNVEAPTINYATHIDQYWHAIEQKKTPLNPALLRQRTQMQDVLTDLITSNTPTALCHHDPVTANFVGTENRLYLIDWEYAAHGLPIMDYAALTVEWKINDATVRARTGINPELLVKAKTLYQYLCALWEEITT